MLDRRHFLAGCLAGGCASVMALTGPDTAWADERYSAGLDAPRVVGDWYLDRYPRERDARYLKSALRRAIPGFPEPGESFEQAALRAGISDSCARDFEQGDVVSIGGWLLARTECRLCALVSFS